MLPVEVGTFEQLLVTPYRPFEILVGKAVPAMVIGIAEGTLIIIVGVFTPQPWCVMSTRSGRLSVRCYRMRR